MNLPTPPDLRALPTSTEPAKADLDPVFTAVARYFGLLAEPTRLKILHSICDNERQVSAIVGDTGASQTNVSRHLALLHQAGVVSRRRHRNAVFYKGAEPGFAEVCGTVCKQLASRIDDGQPLREQLQQFAARH
jgi:DNA-binding transcriptional ArsR family regulator